MNIPETKATLLKRWRGGKKICQKNKSSLNIYEYRKRVKEYLNTCNNISKQRECSKDEKPCGQRVCIPKDADCPVINLLVSETGNQTNSKGKFSNERNETFFVENESTKVSSTCLTEDLFPISKIYMIPEKICEGGSSFSYAFPTYYQLSQNTYCNQDINFQTFDSLSDDLFFKYNDAYDIIDNIHFTSRGDNDAWNLVFSRMFGSLYVECLQKKYAIHTVFGKIYFLKEFDLFFNYFHDLPEK